LAEPIQTITRRHNVEKAYKKLKDINSEAAIYSEDISTFVDTLNIPEQANTDIPRLTPHNYISNTAQQANNI
tara:strand:+ start:989 stop:1204 length:216 start_codon:yes stop_codon:yes gene_type:complete